MRQTIDGHCEKRSRREEAAIAALLACPTIDAAAQQAGVGESTLRGWLRDPSFQGRYRLARRQVVEQAMASLQRAAGEAVETLRRNLTCGVPASEIAAAKAIVDQALKAVELEDMVERIEQLEQATAQTAERKERSR